MRSLIAILLTGLIAACPFLCGADEIGHGTQCGRTACDEGREVPDQCPEDGDSCVCRGAVQTPDGRAATPDGDASTPLFILAPPLAFLNKSHHHTWDGAPSGLAGWGDSLTVRAYLQNFRF